MKILNHLGTLFAAFCIATVLAQVAGLGVLWAKGHLSEEKRFNFLAALYGVDQQSLKEELEKKNQPVDSEQAAFDMVLQQRVKESLNLQLRETALEKGLLGLNTLETQLRIEKTRYAQLKKSFDTKLAELEESLQDEAILEVQRTLEAIPPKQAKDQILRMLAEDKVSGDKKGMTDVVRILKAMALDKRRKVLSEFKANEEPEKLHDILLQIRLGEPDVSLMRATREELKGV